VTGVPGFFFSARLGAAGSELGAVVARQPSDSFVTLLSRRRFEFAIVDDAGMVVSSSNPEYRLRHVVGPDHPPPSAAQLRDIYQLDTAKPIAVVRPARPLNDAHWQVNGEPRLLSVKRMGETQYRLAIVSRFDEVDEIRRNYLVFGALLALFGLPAAVAILAMLAGHARQRAAARQLASANERLAAANEDKNRYLGIAAHDLRNPLSSVRGLSQLMLEMPMPPEQQRELVSTVYRTSDEMLGLVNDLLDVARIESGRIDLNLAPCDVADLVAHRLQHLRPHAERKRIGLRFEAVDAMAVIDKARFGQVIDNLVSNAIKFSPIGSTVRILLENADGSVRLVVEDEGPGFSEADRAGLFKNFQKLSARPTGGESSTGLGLSIAKKVVDTHGGAIAVEGAAGGGARFVVTIPAGGPPAKEGNHG
jgi:signal transduction histidine kinase